MWFTEDPWPPMLIAGFGALICLGLWNSDRRPRHMILAFLCALICAGIYVAEGMIVTEGERLREIVVKLCDDFRKKSPNGADIFSDGNKTLKGLYTAAQLLVTLEDEPRLTDFQTEVTNNNSRATVHFRANATISVAGFGNVGHQPARLLLTFQKEKGEWKIIDVERLHPLNGRKMELLSKDAG